MAFIEEIMPTKWSYGSSAGAGFDVGIIKADSGRESRTIRRGGLGQHMYDISANIKSYDELTELKAFFMAVGGAANGWLLDDDLDNHSNPANSTWRRTPGTKDQRIGVGNGVATSFQLTKTYAIVTEAYVRNIYKPKDGTVQIWVNNVLKTEGVDYTIDYTTGIVLFSSAVTNGHVIDASFYFYVPVRFKESVSAGLMISASEFDNGDLSSIEAEELMFPQPGNTSKFPYRGAVERLIQADIALSLGLGCNWTLSSSASGKSAILPDPTDIPAGGPHFYVKNGGATHAIALKDHTGTTLLSLTSGTGCEVLMTVDASNNKVWQAQ